MNAWQLDARIVVPAALVSAAVGGGFGAAVARKKKKGALLGAGVGTTAFALAWVASAFVR